MLRYFLHLPIVWQIALAPAMMLAMTSGAFWWIDSNTEQSLTALEESDQSLSASYQAANARLQHTDELIVTIYRIHSDVMRTISPSGTGLSATQIADIRNQIATGIAHAKELTAEDAANTALLGEYERAVTRVGNTAGLDQLTAIGLLAPVETKLDSAILALRETERAEIQNEAAEISQRSSDTLRRFRALAYATRTNRWAVAACIFAICLIFCALLGRKITKPLSAIARAMTRLANGDTQVEIPATDRHDEIGQMAQALIALQRHMVADKLTAAEQVEARRLLALNAARVRKPAVVVQQPKPRADQTADTAITTMVQQKKPPTAGITPNNTSATSLASAISTRSNEVPTKNAAVENMRHLMNEVTRSSITQSHRSVTIDLPCRLTIANQVHEARVTNLSTTGASVTPGSPHPPGTQGKIDIDGVGITLPVTVQGTTDNALTLAFVLDVATRFRVSETLEQLAKGITV
jgi:HAMP domain-containing protein